MGHRPLIIDRREFLLATLSSASCISRSPPRDSYDGPEIEVGPTHSYPIGSVTLEAQRLFVIHDQRGFYALSAICTHQGCVLAVEDDHILCNCHYATFDLEGAVTNGPATVPLASYEVVKSPSGRLVVRLRQIPSGSRLSGTI